ncbi:MAG: ACP S-malonyltransferase [Anaerocolumna sp.]
MERIAVLFPGQGAQFVGMGEKFHEQYNICKQTYEEASDAFGKDVSKLCFSGRTADLWDFTNMQVAVVTTSVAIYRAYMHEIGIPPHFAMGHSMGEFAALTCAGPLKLYDTIKILIFRGNLVKKIIKNDIGKMTIVDNLSESKLLEIVKKYEGKVYISCYNSQNQHALSGYDEPLQELEAELSKMGAVVSPLMSGPPMHSPLMQDIRDELFAFVSAVKLYSFNYPVIMNTTGQLLNNEALLPHIMADQLVSPVLWEHSVKSIHKFGSTTAIEMSPKQLLSNFTAGILPNGEIRSAVYGVKDEREQLVKELNSNKVNFRGKANFPGICLGILASTPNNAQTDESYDAVKQNYDNIVKLKEQDTENISKAMDYLLNALRAKKVDYIDNIIKKLMDTTNTMYDLSGFLN